MLSAALVSLALAVEPIRLSPGTQQLLKVPNVTRVALGTSAVADVRPTGHGELLITANQVGRTSPNPRLMPLVAENISAAFQRQGLTNARAVAYGGKIVLEGSVADERELQKAMMIANSHAGAVTNAFSR